MEHNQSLDDRLAELRQYGPDEPLWYRFVRDHKRYLKQKSAIRTFTPEELVKYRFRPMEFYVDKVGGKSYMTWIFLFVNDIRDPSEFNENHITLRIVNPDDIDRLYQIFSTSQASQSFSADA